MKVEQLSIAVKMQLTEHKESIFTIPLIFESQHIIHCI
jgi:hypothetical protein